MEVAPTSCLVFGGCLALQRGAQAAAGDDVPVSLLCLPRGLQGETTRGCSEAAGLWDPMRVSPDVVARVALGQHWTSVGPVSPFRGWSEKELQSPMLPGMLGGWAHASGRVVPLLGVCAGFNLKKWSAA